MKWIFIAVLYRWEHPGLRCWTMCPWPHGWWEEGLGSNPGRLIMEPLSLYWDSNTCCFPIKYLSFPGSVGATERLLCLAPLTLDLKWGHGQHIRSNAPMKGDKNVIQDPRGCNSEISADQESVPALALTCALTHPLPPAFLDYTYSA